MELVGLMDCPCGKLDSETQVGVGSVGKRKA